MGRGALSRGGRLLQGQAPEGEAGLELELELEETSDDKAEWGKEEEHGRLMRSPMRRVISSAMVTAMAAATHRQLGEIRRFHEKPAIDSETVPFCDEQHLSKTYNVCKRRRQARQRPESLPQQPGRCQPVTGHTRCSSLRCWMLGCRDAGVPECRSAGVPECRVCRVCRRFDSNGDE